MRWLKGIGVVSPDTCNECSADCALRPMPISSQRPENSRFHLKPLLALLGGCSLSAPGVMRIPGKARISRVRKLSNDEPELVLALVLNGTGSSSMVRGTSLEGEGTLLASQGDPALWSEW